MQGTLFKSGQKILKALFDWLNSTNSDSIESRWLDEHNPGIVKGELGEFVITVTSGSANISTGTAYDSAGERISITNATISYNVNNIIHSTFDGVVNFSTPISSGSYQIPLSNPATNYLWIRKINTIDDSVYSLHEFTNVKQFYKQTDGYEIKVTTSTITATSTVQTTSIFQLLGTVAMPAETISYTNRQYSRIKEWKSRITTPLSDLSDKTQSYILSTSVTVQNMFLDDHIRSVGTASLVSSNNPHGTSIYDGGFSDDYRVSLHNKVQHTSGFIQETASPISSGSCLTQVTIEGSLTTYATSDALGLMKLAWDSVASAISTTYSEYVVVEGLSGNTAGGIIIDKTETMGTDGTSYWRVDFVNSTYPTGYPSGNNYYVYIDKATRKIAVPALSVPAGNLVVCSVSINNTRTSISIEGITDLRIFGTTGRRDLQSNIMMSVGSDGKYYAVYAP